jgi:hypothetical protein
VPSSVISSGVKPANSDGSPDGNEKIWVTWTPTTPVGSSRPISGEIIDPASLPAAP